MRYFPVLLLSASVLTLAAAAVAQDQPAAPAASASASAPVAPSAPPVASASAPAAPPSAPTDVPPPPQAPPATKGDDEQEPLRLGRLIETESDRARSRRIGGSVVGMVTGGGVMASAAVLFAIPRAGLTTDESTVLDYFGAITIAIGGLQVAASLVSLFIPTPMERLFDAYAPIAIDKKLTPATRVRRGEVLLAAMAESERGRRTTEAATNIVLGVIEAGLAVVFGADDQLVPDPIWRATFAVAFGVGAAATLASAVGSILWERGPAEVAWEHWQASHGTVTVHTESKLELRPVFTPVLGGGTAGLKLRF